MSNTTQTIAITTFLPFFASSIIEFVVPEFGAIGLVGNLAIIYGIARVKREFSSSLRFYYTVLAVAEFTDAAYYAGAEFLEYGLWYLTGSTWRHLILNYSDWSCKTITALYMGSDTVAGYTVVCLGVERIIAVTWPMRAKSILTFRFSVILLAVVCIVCFLILEPLLVMVYDLEYVPFYWHPVCSYNYALSVTAIYMVIEELV